MDAAAAGGGGGGCRWLLIPRPGTDTPAAPSRFAAFWLIKLPALLLLLLLLLDVGLAELVRGGSRGGKFGLASAAVGLEGTGLVVVADSYDGGGGARPSAPSLLPGGGGRWSVLKPEVFTR